VVKKLNGCDVKMSDFNTKTEAVSIESLWLDLDQDSKHFVKLNLLTKEYGKITCKTQKKVEEEKVINGIPAKKTSHEFISISSELPEVINKIIGLLAEKDSIRVKITFTEWTKEGEEKPIRYIKPYPKAVLEWEILEGKGGK